MSLFGRHKVLFSKLNSNFLVGKCYVMALGKNQNFSYFSQESVENAHPSLGFIPVIGHLIEDENGNRYMGSHDVKLDLETFKFKSLCVPFGVVIPSDTPEFEEIEEDNGDIITYLTTNVILWTGNYPELYDAMYDEELLFNQSMEITFDNAEPLESDNEYLDIKSFKFSALCMLGKSDDNKFNSEPCFPSASIKSLDFTSNEFNLEFEKLKKELKTELQSLFNNEKKYKYLKKEGGKIMDEKLELLKSYGKTKDELDFSIDKLSLDELKEKLGALFTKKEQVLFSATYKQRLNSLGEHFKDEYEYDSEGKLVKEIYFWVRDFDDSNVFVSQSIYTQNDSERHLYKYSYSINDNDTLTVSEDKVELFVTYLTKEEMESLNKTEANFKQLKNDFEAYKLSHSEDNEAVKELKNYKLSKEKEIFEKSRDSLLNDFIDIKETDEFKVLFKNIDQYDLDTLKKECFYIRGLYSSNQKFSKTKKEEEENIDLPLDAKKESDDPVELLFKKYLKK